MSLITTVEVPRHIVKAAKELSRSDEASEFVDEERVDGWPCVVASGNLGWHTDHYIPNRWSLLLVVRNDLNSIVQSFAQPVIKPQPIGTLLLLDIWHRHRLRSLQSGCDDNRLAWVALNWDVIEHPTKAQCLKDVKAFLATENRRLI